MKRKCVIAILSLCLISSTLSAFAHEADRLRPRFFEGGLSVSPVPLAGQQTTMDLELTPVAGDCESATIRFRAPAGIALLGRSIFEDQYLARDLSRRYSTSIEILEEGNYTLQATVYFQLPDGQRRAEHFFTYLSAGRTYSQVRADVPFSTVAVGLDSKPTRMQMLAPSAVPRRAADSTINISGYITYYDDNLSQELPIRRVTVELLEEDRQGSQQIDSAYTDDDGFYFFEDISNLDPEDGTGRDVQLRIYFENDVLRITDAEDILYKFETLTMYNVPDGQLNNNYFLDSQNQHRCLGHIFNSVVDAHDFLQENVNWSRKKITVRWP